MLGELGGVALIGISYSSLLLLTSISQILGGALADTIGRKRTITLSLALRILAIAPMLFLGVNVATATALVLAFELTRFLGAPAQSSLIYESVGRGVIGRVYAALRLIPQAFSVAGAALIGYLAEVGVLPQFLALLTLSAIVMSMCFKETLEDRRGGGFREYVARSVGKTGEGLKMLIKSPSLRMLTLVSGSIEMTGFMSWIYVPILLSSRGMDPGTIGLIYSIATIARSMGTAVAGYLVDRYGAYVVIIIDSLTSAPCWLIMALTRDPYISAIAFLANEFMVFSSLAIPIAIMDSVDKSIRGTVRGGYGAMVTLMGSGGVALGSVLYSIDPSLPFLTTGAAWICIALILVLSYPKLSSKQL